MIVNIGMFKVEKTGWSAFCTFIAALANIFLNYLLVPAYGGMGAAVATALAFLIRISVSLYVSERLWRIRYPLAIFAWQIAAGMLATGGILVMYHHNQQFWKIGSVTILTIVFLIGLAAERKHFIRFYHAGKNRFYRR